MNKPEFPYRIRVESNGIARGYWKGRMGPVAEGVVVIGLLLTTLGCQQHSHPDDHGKLKHTLSPTPDHIQATLAPEVIDSSHDDADEIELDPFFIESNVIDGTVFPEGQSMILMVRPVATPSSPPPTEFSLFFLRSEAAPPTDGPWVTALVGKQTRSESLIFNDEDIEFVNRGTSDLNGFKAKGGIIHREGARFEVEVTRAMKQRARVHRKIQGIAAGGMLCALNDLVFVFRESSNFHLKKDRRFSMNIGLLQPDETTASVDGRWTSVSLTGAVRRKVWTLEAGNFTVTSAQKPKANPGKPTVGTYSLGPHGAIVLTSDPAQDIKQHGTIAPAHRAGVLLTARETRFTDAAFWWKGSGENKPRIQAGNWTVFGRMAAEEENTNPPFIFGTADITEDGVLTGQLAEVGIGSSFNFKGKIDSDALLESTLQFQIPVSVTLGMTSDPEESEPVQPPAQTPPPHSH